MKTPTYILTANSLVEANDNFLANVETFAKKGLPSQIKSLQEAAKRMVGSQRANAQVQLLNVVTIAEQLKSTAEMLIKQGK